MTHCHTHCVERGRGIPKEREGNRGERFESVRGECTNRYENLMIKIFFDIFFWLRTLSFHPKKLHVWSVRSPM